MKCARCLKTISPYGVHTCTPTDEFRKLEQENEKLKADVAMLLANIPKDTESQYCRIGSAALQAALMSWDYKKSPKENIEAMIGTLSPESDTDQATRLNG